MSPTDKEARRKQIEADIQSKNNVIEILKGMSRKLEEQIATFGPFVPPYMMQQLADLGNQIAVAEQERAKLETEYVEGDLPLAEVQFQVLVAEAWSRSSGWLSLVDNKRLEMERLRLGIEQYIADKHHDTVRKRLAMETLLDLELNDIQGAEDTRSRAVQRIVRAFRFDPDVTEELLDLNIDEESTKVVAKWIDTTHTIWYSEQERRDLKNLFERLVQAKGSAAKTTPSLGTLPQTWEGHYTYGDTQRRTRMILSIEQIHGSSITGRFEWPDEGATSTQMAGERIDRLNDVAEQPKWNHLAGIQSGQNTVRLKLTEPSYIRGHQTERQGVYYALINDGMSMVGVWFKTPSSTQALGTFELQLRR